MSILNQINVNNEVYDIEDHSSHIDLAEIEREQLNNDIDELLLIIGGGENE